MSIQDITNLIQIGTAPKPKKETFTSEEVIKLWENVDKIPFIKYILIMIYTAMRPGKLQSLTPDMIDLDNNRIIGAGIKTELGEEQPILFSDEIKHLLVNYVSSYKKKAFGEKFKEIIIKLDLNKNLTPNCCRHTTATGVSQNWNKPCNSAKNIKTRFPWHSSQKIYICNSKQLRMHYLTQTLLPTNN